MNILDQLVDAAFHLRAAVELLNDGEEAGDGYVELALEQLQSASEHLADATELAEQI